MVKMRVICSPGNTLLNTSSGQVAATSSLGCLSVSLNMSMRNTPSSVQSIDLKRLHSPKTTPLMMMMMMMRMMMRMIKFHRSIQYRSTCTTRHTGTPFWIPQKTMTHTGTGSASGWAPGTWGGGVNRHWRVVTLHEPNTAPQTETHCLLCKSYPRLKPFSYSW